MTLSLFLGLLVLVHSCWTASLPAQVFQASPLLLSPGCNDSQVLSVAGLALQGINDDRKEGYEFSLNRVVDVREHQGRRGSVYYLTFDVLETGCHVLSRKNWTDCAARELHQSVYGQCKAIFYLSMPERIPYLPAYNCTVRPVFRGSVIRMCPDCPGPIYTKISDASILEAVSECLEKYNKEVAVGKKFSLFQLTKAYYQWILGPFYFVEYLVTETPCTKSLPGSEKCLQPSADSKPVGLCRGSLSEIHEKHVSVTCEFFQTQPTSAPGSHPTEQQPPEQSASPSAAAPLQEGPKGSVQLLPDFVDDINEGDQERKPLVTFPVHIELTTEPLGEVLRLPSYFKLEKEDMPVVLPFPGGSRSNGCPGVAANSNPLILPP
ncbi:fetuin-B [Dromiciops gliroides]|uniref:fetuin-B n=1 Tax=Dromiciops gliroides TaxID=33562 RepID=UPI001CC3EE40|nr:fetuin-B [Dromiciops gliroides]XP_043853873.1 fetuin-B [Dromiciops gliroides]XP_043853874.1 fetuin-B [Dromiciops gliroides]